MSWLKVDDGTWCDPWVVMVGNEAFGIFTRLGSYCAQYLTDGLVPAEIAAMITAGRSELVDELERVGKVKRRETGSLYLPGYLRDNPSRREVEVDRRNRKARAEAAAAARWGPNGRARQSRAAGAGA